MRAGTAKGRPFRFPIPAAALRTAYVGVRSTPAKWGVKAALGASSATHAVTWAMFAWFGALTGFGVPYWIGLALVAAVLVYEHAIVKADDLSKANRAFFTANGVVAIALFAFALGNLLLR